MDGAHNCVARLGHRLQSQHHAVGGGRVEARGGLVEEEHLKARRGLGLRLGLAGVRGWGWGLGLGWGWGWG